MELKKMSIEEIKAVSGREASEAARLMLDFRDSGLESAEVTGWQDRYTTVSGIVNALNRAAVTFGINAKSVRGNGRVFIIKHSGNNATN